MGTQGINARRVVGALALAVLIGAASGPEAEATFPGRNGSLLVLVSDDCGEPSDNCEDSPDRLELVSPTSRRNLLLEGSTRAQAASWAADGRRIAFRRAMYASVGQPGPAGLFVAADGIRARSQGEISAAAVPGTASATGAALSPDGSMVASHTPRGLEVFDVAGSASRPIFAGGFKPDWSSSGRIAFEQAGNIWTVNPDGSDPRRITHRGGRSPSWSPHGSRIAFARRGSIYAIHADGTHRRLIARRASRPIWSPDGRSIAFLRTVHQDECGYDGTGCDINYLRIINLSSRRSVGVQINRQGTPPELLLAWRPIP